jgi:hypothetical protein
MPTEIRLSLRLAGAVAVLGLAACTDPGACTLNIEPGITVRTLEAGTGRNVTDEARGTVSEGAYVDSLRPFAIDPDQKVVQLSAADERAGTYDVFVERAGYQSVSLGNVEVEAGECHVQTVPLDITMVPIP